MAPLIAILAGLVTMAATYRLFFSSIAEIVEAVVDHLTPDIISLFRGELEGDLWPEIKLGLWITLGVVAGLFAHAGLSADSP